MVCEKVSMHKHEGMQVIFLVLEVKVEVALAKYLVQEELSTTVESPISKEEGEYD